MSAPANANMTAQWVFDPLPASRARRGGEPSSHVFAPSVDSFVREVLQNALDQSLGEAAEVHFRFKELSGLALDAFLQALSWSSLEPHLSARLQGRAGRALGEYLEHMRKRRRLLVLIVEDRGTVGLTGGELEGDSHFRALCKDTLYSHKRSQAAGGSYGLGKSVLWTFSGLSTVLFLSNLSEESPGQRSPRLFGRAELPSHALDDGEWYAGAGWFGTRMASPEGERAVSVWADAATKLARALHLQRSDQPGTSLLIVGFRDPSEELPDEAEVYLERMREAAVRHFWPTVVMPGRPLALWFVGRRQQIIGEDDLGAFTPFADCYRQRDATRTKLEQPGDVVVRDVPVELPARRDGQRQPKEGRVRLCVRLGEEKRRDPLMGRVALFRGPGMVVKYWDQHNLAASVRPFHAVLACGRARNPEAPGDADEAVEHFLRMAEPPGHDDWTKTPGLRAEYQRGYAKALDRLKQRVREALKEIVVPEPHRGAQGPDKLRRRFPIGKRGKPGPEPSVFHFNGLTAHFDGECWHFWGRVRPEVEAKRWHCAIRLFHAGEDGREIETLAVSELTTNAGAGRFSVESGRGVLVADEAAPEIAFGGRSEPVDLPLGELGLEVTGRIGG